MVGNDDQSRWGFVALVERYEVFTKMLLSS